MNDTAICWRSAPIHPPTNNATCAIPAGGNRPSVLQFCRDTPVAFYNDTELQLPNCYLYCNITSSDLTTVENCLSSTPADGPVEIICWSAGSEETSLYSSGSRIGTSKLLVVLGVLTTAVVVLNV